MSSTSEASEDIDKGNFCSLLNASVVHCSMQKRSVLVPDSLFTTL